MKQLWTPNVKARTDCPYWHDCVWGRILAVFAGIYFWPKPLESMAPVSPNIEPQAQESQYAEITRLRRVLETDEMGLPRNVRYSDDPGDQYPGAEYTAKDSATCGKMATVQI